LEDRTCPSLVLALGLNDGTGTTALDASGQGNNGTLNGASWSSSGKYGGALSFDGVNDWLTVADANSLDLTTGMTLEAWVYPTALNSWETTLLKEAGNELAYSLYADNNGNDTGGPRRPAGYIRQGSNSYNAAGSSQLPLNTWTHLAATYDGAALRLYVNGTQVSSLARTGAINTSTGPLRVGGNAVWGEFFNGSIDEVRVYSNALTTAEIQNDMDTPIADNTPPTITTRIPDSGATGVLSSANVQVTFSEPLNPSTVSTTTFELRDDTGATVPAVVTYDVATRTATLDPTGSLTPAATYSMLVRGGTTGSRVMDLAGNALAADSTWSFTVAPLSLALNDVSVTEGNTGTTNAEFTVTLSAPSSQTVTVTYATADGTATAGADYQALSATTLTFAPGEISKSVTVTVLGDTLTEGNETFTLNLTSPVNAVLADAQGVGIIVDDEATLIGSEGFGYRAWTSSFEALDLIPGGPGVATIRATGNNNANLVTLTGSNRFNFYGTAYSSFYVSTNGLLTFGGSNSSGTNANLTDSPRQPAIAPLWDDWVNVTGQAMLLARYDDFNSDGTGDRLVLEWNNVQGYRSSPSSITFQVILQLNTGTVPGEFAFNYPDLDAGNAVSNGASASVGIKDTLTQGTRRLLVSYNTSSPYVGSGKAITFKPDVSAPTVAVTAPADGSTVAGNVSVSASADDNTAVAGVQFLVNGVNLGTEDTTSPYGVSWDTTVLSNGAYTLTARARDAAGNVKTSDPVSVTVNNVGDTTPPTVSVTAPASGSTVSGSVAISANASDNVGVAGVRFRIDGVDVGAEDTASPYSISWNTASATNGTHQITAIARDAAGNTATSAVVTVTVDNTSPAQVGQWSAVMDWPIVAMNSVLLKDGRMLIWDGGPACIGSTSPHVWDPVANTFTPVPIPYFNDNDDDIFCSGQALLADGRVLVVGGHDCNGPQLGIKMVNIFDPATLTWTRGPDMAFRRWYPTATTLADGRVLVTAGSVNNTIDYVPTPEIYDPVTNSWTTLTAANLTVPNYPFVFQTPDGKVLVAGSDEAKMATYTLDVASQTWTTVDPTILDAGSAVQYRPGKVMKAGSSYLSPPSDNGGNIPSSANTYVLDANQAGATWQQTASMASPRTHLNLTVLPDGNVLATGGSSDIGGVNPSSAVKTAELWSPATQTWSTMASQQRPRMYHSTALLMPDGRVVSTGSGHNYFNNHAEFNAEIYSPPYLFKGARPTITSAPGQLGYGSNFFVATPDAANITSVVLIRNGSATHAFNMDQRYVPLTFSQTTGGLTVQGPSDANLAPAGHYMLFVINGNGVPSVAPFVRLAAPYEDTVPPTAPASLSGTATTGTVTLTWSPAADNVGVYRYDVYRSATPNFTPGTVNRIGQTSTTTFIDAGRPAGTYYYRVTAADALNHVGPSSNEAVVTVAMPIQLVQKAGLGHEFSTNVISLSLPSPITAGNFLIITGTAARPARTITITDTSGNTFLPALGPVSDPAQDVNAYIWYVPAAQAGSNTFTLTPGGGASAMEIHVTEWTGLASVSPLDQTSFGLGVGAQISSGSKTTAVPGELVFGYTFSNGNSTAGSGFTGLSLINGDLDEYLVQTSPGLVATTFTQDRSDAWVALMATFKPMVSDGVPPTAPENLTASGAISSVSLNWSASTDNVAVAGYYIYRSPTPNFTPALANRVGQTAGIAYTDLGLAAGTYYYRVIAFDGAGNLSPSSNEATASVTGDTTAPTVSITAPTDGATVTGVISVTADATDNVAVAGVQFFLDGNLLGAEDTAAPYAITWNTASVPNGSHTLTARARDAAGNNTVSSPVNVTVNNSAPSGLVLALGLNEGSGSTANDASGTGNNGTLNGASWNGSGKYGGALSFDGANDWLTVADANNLDLTTGMTLEAWVYPTALNSWETALLKEAGNELAYSLYADNNGNDTGGPRRPAGYIRQGSNSYTATGSSQLPLNTWTHLAATYDGSALRLYVNGTQVSSLARSGSINTSTGPLRVGGNAVWGEYFNGSIDEVRVYSRALTTAEIQSDMDTPIGSGLAAATAALTYSGRPLTMRELEPIRREAIARWRHAGLTGQQLAVLARTNVTVTNLPGVQLGLADAGRVWIDSTAAGYGWYIDPTPRDDHEFSGRSNDVVASRMDLLTVLTHELGHILGFDHEAGDNSLMAATLTPGDRRMPASRAISSTLTVRSNSMLHSHGYSLLKELRKTRMASSDAESLVDLLFTHPTPGGWGDRAHD